MKRNVCSSSAATLAALGSLWAASFVTARPDPCNFTGPFGWPWCDQRPCPDPCTVHCPPDCEIVCSGGAISLGVDVEPVNCSTLPGDGTPDSGENPDSRNPDDDCNGGSLPGGYILPAPQGDAPPRDDTPIWASGHPVDLRYGDKLETATDLVVQLPGEDFRITRRYSSDPTLTRINVVGEQWTMPMFQYLRRPDLGTPNDMSDDTVIYYHHGGNAVMRFDLDGGVWKGPANSTITLTAHKSDPEEDPDEDTLYYVLEEKGRWTRLFHGPSSPGVGSSYRAAAKGALAAEYNSLGQVRKWGWQYFSNGRRRLAYVDIQVITHTSTVESETVTHSEPVAMVTFHWRNFGFEGANGERIHEIQVLRPRLIGGVWKLFWTNSAFYTYHEDITVVLSGENTALGTAGNLVQVQVRDATDDGLSGQDGILYDDLLRLRPARYLGSLAAEARDRYTQYRYYYSGLSDGAPNQLKMVFEPAQLEHYAWQTGESPFELLLMSDSATAYGSTAVRDLAAKIVRYAGATNSTLGTVAGKVREQDIQTDCGCGGAGHGMRLRYSYFTPGSGPYARIVRIEEEKRSGTSYVPHRRYWHDMKSASMGGGATELHTTSQVVEEITVSTWTSDPGARVWCTRYDVQLDTSNTDVPVGRVKAEHLPSTISPSSGYSRDSTTHVPTFASRTDNLGLVRHYTYYESGTTGGRRLKSVAVGYEGQDDDFEVIAEYAYRGANSNERDDLLSSVKRYRVGTSPTANDTETMEYDYTTASVRLLHGTDGASPTLKFITSRTSRVESDLESENGPSTPTWLETVETYYAIGSGSVASGAVPGLIQNIERPDDTVTKYEYDRATGQPTKIVETHTGTSAATLTTSIVYDLAGRVSTVRQPDGSVTNVARAMDDFGSEEDPDGGGSLVAPDRYVETTFPAAANADSASGHNAAAFAGPISRHYMDVTGATIGVREFSADSGGGAITRDSSGAVTAHTLGTELTRTYVERDLAGMITSELRYHNIAGNGFYETQYAYDTLGRLSKVTSPTGSIMETIYDVLDRPIEVKTGTSSGNMVKVSARFYDCNPESAAQGVGDGNVSIAREYTDSDSDYRDTKLYYDIRNRLTHVVSPNNPIELRVYDNLDRVIERGLFEMDLEELPTVMTHAGRGLFETVKYSQRGLVYRVSRAIDPAQSSPTFLSMNRWYDAVGRIIKESAPNAPSRKMTYDALGRPSVVYITDATGDAAPGGSGNYTAASSVTGDTVLEQTSIRYITESTGVVRGAGQADLITTWLRRHDSSVTGALTESGQNAPATYSGVYYDTAGRAIVRAEFGTNDTTTDLFKLASAPSWPPSGIPSYSSLSTAIVSRTHFGDRGLPASAVDPSGKIVKSVYDDLGRPVGVLENWIDGVIERSTDTTNHPWGWKLTDTTNLGADEDRATITVYNGEDRATNLVAVTYTGSAIAYQNTRYVYDVSIPGTPGTYDNKLHTKSLLSQAIYPDSDGTGGDYVTYHYNRQGELLAMIDQNGTRHDFDRDSAGRVVKDAVSAFGTNIDGTIDNIAIAYDNMGRRDTVKSKNGSTVKNAVQFTYTPLWQIEEVRQNPLGDLPGSNIQHVLYTYSSSADSSNNYSRLTSLSYPTNPGGGIDRTQLQYLYGSALSSAISRPDELRWEGPDGSGSLIDKFARMDYLGASTIARRYVGDHASSTYTHRLGLDRYLSPTTGAGSTGEYQGLDRFGRVKRQLWVRTDTAGLWDPTTFDSMHPARHSPAIIDLAYTYDMESNPLARYDRRANDRAQRPDRDEHYTYDGLDRLIQADRGLYNHAGSPPTFTNGGTRGQKWELDPLGNWKKFRVNVDGNGSFTDNGDTLDERTFNLVNETLTRTLKDSQLGTQPPPSSAVGLDPAFDAAGNMTSRPKLVSGTTTAGWTLKYDAWNRLVHVEVGSDDRAAYGYYGTHWRAWRVADNDADTTMDQANTYYYDASWRLLEERIDEGHAPGGGWTAPAVPASIPTDAITQRIWGLEYIDELVYFHTDGSAGTPSDGDFKNAKGYYALVDRLYSVIGVVRATDGWIEERVRYTPYGVARVFRNTDVNRDGTVNFTDLALVNGNYGATMLTGGSSYDPDYDINSSGSIDFADLTAVSGSDYGLSSPVEGQMSLQTIANTVGYAGYLFDPATEMYCVRFRWYEPDSGRWINRDPMKYFDAMNLYENVRSGPLQYVDPLGLGRHMSHCRMPGELEERLQDRMDAQSELYDISLAMNQLLQTFNQELAALVSLGGTLQSIARAIRYDCGEDLFLEAVTFGMGSGLKVFWKGLARTATGSKALEAVFIRRMDGVVEWAYVYPIGAGHGIYRRGGDRYEGEFVIDMVVDGATVALLMTPGGQLPAIALKGGSLAIKCGHDMWVRKAGDDQARLVKEKQIRALIKLISSRAREWHKVNKHAGDLDEEIRKIASQPVCCENPQ